MKQSVGIYIKIILVLLLPIGVHAADLNQTSIARNPAFLPKQQVIRDPFTPSSYMYEVISTQSLIGAGKLGFVPLIGEKPPKMKLRGFISNKGKKPLALLEVQGLGTFMVREGDEINIDPTQPRNAIRITQIDRLSVTVETGLLGSIRVQR